MKMSRFKKAVCWLLCAYIIFFAVSVLLPPLRRRPVSAEYQQMTARQLQDTQTTGERVCNIETSTDALLWRLRLIESAQREILLTTYALQLDNSGLDVLSALQAAAQRGVQVRILLDGVNCALSWSTGPQLRALAAEPNVQLRMYAPIDLARPWRLNYRMHDKYLVIDDTAYLLGGRNTGDLFLGHYIEYPNYDRDMLVLCEQHGESPSLTQLRQRFERMWNLPDCQPREASASKTQQAAGQLAEHYRQLHQRMPEAFEPADWQAETVPAEQITLLESPIEAACKAPEIWYSIYSRMRQGSDLLIQTPYIICDKAMYRDLTQLTKEGRRVQIITNSAASGANVFGCADYLNNQKKIRNTMCEIYEAYKDSSIHTKTILVDEDLSLVGSYNLDMRSSYLNTELMLAIRSRPLNDRLRAEMEQLTRISDHLLPDGTRQPGPDYAEPEKGLGRTLMHALLRLLTLPVRHLL